MAKGLSVDASHTSKGDFHHGPNTLITTLPVASANDEKNIIISGGEEIVTIGPLDSAATAVHVDDNGEVFSLFTVGQKRALVLATSFVAWLSPLSAAIYYPVLTQHHVGDSLGVSSAKINITVTMYLIAQTFSPMMVAGFSEDAGRRPAYIICFVIYIVSNLALALQNNYVALLLLRMVQAAGSSGFIVLSQGIIGDCTVSAERGEYVAYSTLAVLLSPSLSPIIGGLIGEYAGWHWIFWFLLFLSLATLIPVALFLPETSRKLVDNGSIPPPRLCDNITDHIRLRNRKRQGIAVDEHKRLELLRNHRLSFPNPVGTLIVLADGESSILLLVLSLALACYYAIFTDISQSFYDIYGFTSLQVSLVSLAVGAGGLVATFTTGYLLDRNYRRHAKQLGMQVHKDRKADLSAFPIEKARLQIGMPMLIGSALGVIGYGWTLHSGMPVAVPIVFLVIIGYCVIASSQVLDVLMVDIYPGKAADASAARNACQCILGAAASAAIEPMIQSMGIGWSYTTLAAIFLASSTSLIFCMRHGIEWRVARAAREKVREEKRKASEQFRSS